MSIAINTPLPAFAVAAPTEVKSPVPTIIAAVKRVAVALPRVRDPSLSDLLPDLDLLFSFIVVKLPSALLGLDRQPGTCRRCLCLRIPLPNAAEPQPSQG